MVRLMDFYDEGLCGQVDGDAFFPEKDDEVTHGRRSSRTTRMAKAVCGNCPVRPLCLKWALDNPKAAGDAVWGGFTGNERKDMVTPRRR